MDPVWLAFPGLLIWSSILLLPWRPWSPRETLDAEPASTTTDLSQITVIIPARNEQDVIGRTLKALAGQGNDLRIILVDDQSSDNTLSVAQGLGIENLKIIKGRPLPPGWSGKLWALEQGRTRVETESILLLDADIELQPGTLPSLWRKMREEKLQFISLMAFLRMQSFWEKLLMPAFIFFFKLLYPFHVSNSRSKAVAAAAGGCIVISAEALERIGGFAALKDELIDDCALARRVKNLGYRTWTGLTHSVISQRCYDDLKTIREMVTRTAFTQLRYSSLLLILCTLLMASAFILPVAGLFTAAPSVFALSIFSLSLMAGSYIPTLKYYGMSSLWALALPVIGVIYLLMTWNSAINHWGGTGSLWKDRAYNKQMD